MLFFEMESTWGLRVSCSSYDFENMEKIHDVTDEFKDVRENIGQGAIRSAMESNACGYRLCGWVIEILSVLLFVYGIVLTFQLTLPEFQNTFLQLYFLCEVMLKPKLFSALILVALLPVILVVAAIYLCFCKKGE
jgi:cytochrome b subunit of formate dehydrogenase